MDQSETDLFVDEDALLESARQAMERHAQDPAALRDACDGLLGAYRSLVSQMRRMVKISDRIENKLIKANCQLEEAHALIEAEKDKYASLLLSVFPETIGQELLHERQVAPRRFDAVSVMFTDFVDFTQLTAEVDPELLIRELNDVFGAFDLIMQRNGCERVKTLGDGYMAVCGAPRHQEDHAGRMVGAALECLDYLAIRQEHATAKNLDIAWQIRIGIHSGPVVGGIVGTQHFSYDIFGDTVNLASRIEQQAPINGIAVSEATRALIEQDFELSPLGVRSMKGKGDMPLYAVLAEKTLPESIEILQAIPNE